MKFIIATAIGLIYSGLGYCQTGVTKGETVRLEALKDTIVNFTGRELTVYLNTLGTPENNPTTFLGEPFGGDHSKVGLAVTLLDWKEISNKGELGKHNIEDWAIRLIKSEASQISTFGQLFALKALLKLTKGQRLKESEYGKNLTHEEFYMWEKIGDVTTFYDPVRVEIRNGRPRNYFALALLVNAYAYKLGLRTANESFNVEETGRQYNVWQQLKDTCLATLKRDGGWMDDDGKNRGRFDRYQFEYHRFLIEAAELKGDGKMLETVLPYLKKCNELWWAQFNPEVGHAAPYGRSLQNAWDDVWEQTATLTSYPKFAPASINELSTAFLISWNYYINNQYNRQTHLNKMLEQGRGTYSYAGRNRIFSYTSHSFGKALEAAKVVFENLRKNKIALISSKMEVKPFSKLYMFRNGDKKSGVWVVKTKNNHIAIPIVGGTSAFTADYLPTVHGLRGFQAPVSLSYPAGVPFIEMENEMLAPVGQADSLYTSKDGNHLYAVWNKLVDSRGRASDNASCITHIELLGDAIIFEWNFNFAKPGVIRSWQLTFPTSYQVADLETGKLLAFKPNEIQEAESLEVQFESDFGKPLKIYGPGESALSKGHFSNIPLILDWSGGAKAVNPGVNYQIRLLLRP